VSAASCGRNEVFIVQMKELRRVVTGIDAAGKSYVAIDGPPANIRESDGRGAAEFWITDATPADNRAPGDPAAERPPRLEPPTGGSVIRYFMVEPEKTLSPAELEAQSAARFAAMGASHCRVDTSRHPSMHTTRTVDYIVVLSGHVTLLLDQGEVELKPFDVVVQRGTNHGWVNRGSEPAMMAAILIDAKPL
jgi:mannose-6-phosphate isomerase-like protein (cupin superfamily)